MTAKTIMLFLMVVLCDWVKSLFTDRCGQTGPATSSRELPSRKDIEHDGYDGKDQKDVNQAAHSEGCEKP